MSVCEYAGIEDWEIYRGSIRRSLNTFKQQRDL